MHEALDLALALTASYLGFACLALSMPRHWRDVTSDLALPAGRVTALHAIGYSALAVSLVLTLLRDGASFGSVLWVLVLTAGAATVAFTLTWRPAWLRLAVRVARVAQRRFLRIPALTALGHPPCRDAQVPPEAGCRKRPARRKPRARQREERGTRSSDDKDPKY